MTLPNHDITKTSLELETGTKLIQCIQTREYGKSYQPITKLYKICSTKPEKPRPVPITKDEQV